ncbi:hypothetical protein JCM10450v2_007112 [Rhodotorula kratochvilovae]
MLTVQAPWLPPEIVEMILEEAFPGFRVRVPRIAPWWLVRLVGEDLLAWIDRTPGYAGYFGGFAWLAMIAPSAAWQLLSYFMSWRSPVPWYLRITGLIACILVTCGREPWAGDLDDLLFLADEQQHGIYEQVDANDALHYRDHCITHAEREACRRARQCNWSDRLRSRYRLGRLDSKLMIRVDLLSRLVHVLVICLVYAHVLPARGYVVWASVICGIAFVTSLVGTLRHPRLFLFLLRPVSDHARAVGLANAWAISPAEHLA